MLSRRLFFGKAAAAAAAGPMAVDAVASQVAEMSLSSPSIGASLASRSNKISSQKDWIMERLKELALGPQKRPIEYVGRLDPDLIANRSMSLSARMRIQADREAARWHERERDALLEELAKLTT